MCRLWKLPSVLLKAALSLDLLSTVCRSGAAFLVGSVTRLWSVDEMVDMIESMCEVPTDFFLPMTPFLCEGFPTLRIDDPNMSSKGSLCETCALLSFEKYKEVFC